MNKNKGTPRAASLTHAETQGLSIFRDAIASDVEIQNSARQLVESARSRDPKAGIFAVIRIPCQVIRQVIYPTNDHPAYCVYDTAEKEKPSHAEAFQRIAGVEEHIKAARRQALFEFAAPTFVPVDQFRNGLLLPLAPPVAP